jgi:DNA-binding MarR family transcriptional regulator
MQNDTFEELAALFFETRQIIRSRVPGNGRHDHNAWLRLETLRFIAQAKDPSMRDIARYVRITAPSATSLVKHLEGLGLIRRTQVSSDKRIVRILVTPKGKRALAAYARTARRTMQAVFGELAAQDIEKLRALLRTVNELHNR